MNEHEMRVYRVPELMQILDVSRQTVILYCERGTLKARKIGGRWAVSAANLKAYIDGVEAAPAT